MDRNFGRDCEGDTDPDITRLANCPGCGVLITGNLAALRDHICAPRFYPEGGKGNP